MDLEGGHAAKERSRHILCLSHLPQLLLRHALLLLGCELQSLGRVLLGLELGLLSVLLCLQALPLLRLGRIGFRLGRVLLCFELGLLGVLLCLEPGLLSIFFCLHSGFLSVRFRLQAFLLRLLLGHTSLLLEPLALLLFLLQSLLFLIRLLLGFPLSLELLFLFCLKLFNKLGLVPALNTALWHPLLVRARVGDQFTGSVHRDRVAKLVPLTLVTPRQHTL